MILPQSELPKNYVHEHGWCEKSTERKVIFLSANGGNMISECFSKNLSPQKSVFVLNQLSIDGIWLDFPVLTKTLLILLYMPNNPLKQMQLSTTGSYWVNWIEYLLRPMSHVYRNQSIDLHSKSIDWFLYESKIGLIWVKAHFLRAAIHKNINFLFNCIKSTDLITKLVFF